MRNTVQDLIDGDTPDYIDLDDLRKAIDQWEATCIRCGAPVRAETSSKHPPVFLDEEDNQTCTDDDGQEGAHQPEDDDVAILTELVELDSEVGADDSLISERVWEDYVREMADDTSGMSSDSWLFAYIDWEKVANDVQMDYTSYTFRGVTYYGR